MQQVVQEGLLFLSLQQKKSPNLLAEGNVIHMLTLTGSEIESFLEATYISPQES